jgi:hypothetical protein
MGASKLTAALTKRICKRLALAVPLKYAAEAEGISERTIHDWLAKGRAGEDPYVAFERDINKALAEAVTTLHTAAILGGRGSSSATWLLEKRYRKEYGKDLPPPENDKPLEIVQRRLDPVKVPVDDDGRAIAQGE